MEDDQQFCLRWNNHQSTLISVFDTLLENETLVDCTIAAEGRFLKAHKVVLSACSPYFATLLQEQYDKHPIFILKDVKFQELRAMMDYMYRGEVNISQDQLAALLKAAESLQIKGLSDNRGTAPRQEQQQPRANIATGKNSYTLETKRPRIGPGPLEPQDVSGSREGSSSPSRRRRKVRRRSIENDVHDNSNSSVTPQTQPSNANLAGVSAMTAAAALASQMTAAGASVVSAPGIAVVGGQQAGTTQLTTNVPKKTESIKGTSDAMNTETLQTTGSITGTTIAPATTIDEQDTEHAATTASKEQKSNHKQQKSKDNASTISPGDMTIEPKSEYDEEANEESVEDLTLDDEMGMEDLDHNAGTSQGGEGSSQEYAWQHDRSQDGLLLTTQDAQQRDPQVILPTTLPQLPPPPLPSEPPLRYSISRQKEKRSSVRTRRSRRSLTSGSEARDSLDQKVRASTGIANSIIATTTENTATTTMFTSMSTYTSVPVPTPAVTRSSSGILANIPAPILDGRRSPFICKTCGRAYQCISTLNRHLRSECNQPKKFVCMLCKRGFHHNFKLTEHYTRLHGGRPY